MDFIPDTIQNLIEQAFESFTQQDPVQAEDYLRQAISLDPLAIEPRYHLANLCSMKDRYDEAAALLKPICRNAEMERVYRWYLFKSDWYHHRETGARQQAVKLSRYRGLPQDSRRELLDFARQNGLYFLFLRLVLQVGSYDDRRDLKWMIPSIPILRLIPSSLWRNTLQKSIDAYRRRGCWRKVKVLLTVASFADRKCPAWPKQIGQVYRLTRDVYDPKFLREKVCYEKVLQLDPSDRESFDALLITLNDMGAWREIIRNLEFLPDRGLTPWHQSLQAVCHANLGELDRADDLYEKLEATDQRIHARFCRGLIALETNREREALDFFQTDVLPNEYRFLNRFFLEIARLRCDGHGINLPDGQSVLNGIPIESSNEEPETTFASSKSPCALCGWSGERQPLWRDSRSGWVRVRCPRCSMISVAPIPSMEEILQLYKQPMGKEKALFLQAKKEVERLSTTPETSCRQMPYFRNLTEWGNDFSWNEFEQSLGEEKRLLDIGCTAGDTLMLFQRCGWNGVGIDVDPDAIAYAKSKGLQVHLGTLDAWIEKLTPFHFITLVDVIEHLQDPLSLLRQVFSLLTPGGLFYLKTPCADSFPHRFLGDRWLESCEHLHFFSRQTLQMMLEKAGFHCIDFKQHFDPTTPFLHSSQWKQKFLPTLLDQWILKTQSGDTIMVLAQKPQEADRGVNYSPSEKSASI